MVKRKMARDYEFRIDDREFKRKMKSMQREFPTFTKIMLGRLGLRLMAKIKKLTPVDTGLLKRSWYMNTPNVRGEIATVEIKNNVVYALAVEMGRKLRNGGFVPGWIMMKLGFKEMEPQIPQILEQEIQTFINRHGGGH